MRALRAGVRAREQGVRSEADEAVIAARSKGKENEEQDPTLVEATSSGRRNSAQGVLNQVGEALGIDPQKAHMLIKLIRAVKQAD